MRRLSQRIGGFQYGDRVRPTAKTIVGGIVNDDSLGTVVGFSRDGRCLRVRRDGRAVPRNFALDFWERVPQAPREI